VFERAMPAQTPTSSHQLRKSCLYYCSRSLPLLGQREAPALSGGHRSLETGAWRENVPSCSCWSIKSARLARESFRLGEGLPKKDLIFLLNEFYANKI